jgi:hypothetical protein
MDSVHRLWWDPLQQELPIPPGERCFTLVHPRNMGEKPPVMMVRFWRFPVP